MLAMAHALAANATSCPELELTDKEAEVYAISVTNVLKWYNVQATQKAIDHATLVMTVGSIYGLRMAAIGTRKKAEAAAKRARPTNVYPIGTTDGTVPVA